MSLAVTSPSSPPELAWTARPVRELLRLSWPIAVSTVSFTVMTMVDTLLLAQLGAHALAGIGIGGVVAFALLCFPMGLLRGGRVLIAQAVGAGHREAYGPYLGAGMILAVAGGLLTALLGVGAALVLPDLAATEASGRAAGIYLGIRVLGAPLALLAVALRESRYAIGDSRWPMWSAVGANVVNVVLAIVFIRGLDAGIAGAAWATVIAHAVELGNLLWVQARERFGVRATRLADVVAVVRVGVPTGLQFLLEVGSFSLVTAMLAAWSERETAAHQIAFQVIHFSFLPASAVAEAASVLAGQAVGAGRIDLVRPVARQSLVVSGVYALLCSAVFALGGGWIAAAFTSDPDLAHITIRLLYVAAVFQVFDAANMVVRSVLRGAGDVRVPAVIGIVTSWVCTPPLGWFLSLHLGLGAVGTWIGLCAEIMVGATILWWRLAGTDWLEPAAQLRATVEGRGAPAGSRALG